MCNRCTRAWLPTNHPKSKGFAHFGERFHWQRIRAIQSPYAELRRKARWTKDRPSLRETREWIAKWRAA